MEQARNVAIVEPAYDAVPLAESEPRLTLHVAVLLLLVASWAALITFSMGFLLEDARLDAAAAASDRQPFGELASVDRFAGQLSPHATPPAVPKWQDIASAKKGEPASKGAPKLQNVAVSSAATTISATEPLKPANMVQPAEFVGVWGAKASACGAKSRRRGYLPATITEDSARAGKTLCRFRDGRRVGSAWTMAADCSERGRKWTSQVRLLVDGDRLTWASAKGKTSYVRCDR